MATISSAIFSATTSAFPCPTCGQELSRRGDLKRHIAQLHPTGNERLWKCPHCPYQHVQKSNVKIHAEKHELKRTGERPHTCPESGCTAAYQDKGLLTRHRKKKHGYQPNHSSRYLEKKGLPLGVESTTTSRIGSEEGDTLQRSQQMYGAPLTPPESASTLDDTAPREPHSWDTYGTHTYTLSSSFDTRQTASPTLRSDVACQIDLAAPSSALRLPPITDLFQKADECERNRPSQSYTPHFPGPLRRPASAHGHLGYHAPRPEYFQRMSATSSLMGQSTTVTRERRPSSTPCLPTPPAFQTTFPSPRTSPKTVLPVVLKASEPTRSPVSFLRQQRRPAPYPTVRNNDPSPMSNAPRWHKWWMRPGAVEPRRVGPLAVRSH